MSATAPVLSRSDRLKWALLNGVLVFDGVAGGLLAAEGVCGRSEHAKDSTSVFFVNRPWLRRERDGDIAAAAAIAS
jgi:hypothetical protein